MTGPQAGAPIQAQPLSEEVRKKLLHCEESIEAQLVGIERIAVEKADMILLQIVYEIRDKTLNLKQRVAMHEAIELAQIRNDLNPSMPSRQVKGVPPN